MSSDYYDEEATRVQEQVARSRDMAQQRDVVRRVLALRGGERVLDVGAGNGILARELCADVGASGEVTGVDPAQSMIEMAGELCPNATFLLGGAEALPVEDAAFDALTACQVLCFVPDLDRAIAEMRRVLKTGARAVILDTDWDSLVWHCRDTELLARVVAEIHRPYACAFVPRTLSRRLGAGGFEITSRFAHPILNWAPDEDAYSYRLAEFLPRTTPSGTAGDGLLWQAEMASMAQAGEYFFSLNRYIFVARKL